MVTRYGQADVPREVSGRGGPAVRPAAADFPRDVCLTVSRNHAVFLLYCFRIKGGTLSTGCVSRSFPPHWSTTSLGLAPVENIWFSLDLIWGMVAPGYVSVVASTPYCLSRLPRPRTRDEPITNVSETAG